MGSPRARGQRLGVDGHTLRRLPALRGMDSRLCGLFRRLLRWQALRPQGRLVGDGGRARASELPKLVPGALSVRVRQVPLRDNGIGPAGSKSGATIIADSCTVDPASRWRRGEYL